MIRTLFRWSTVGCIFILANGVVYGAPVTNGSIEKSSISPDGGPILKTLQVSAANDVSHLAFESTRWYWRNHHGLLDATTDSDNLAVDGTGATPANMGEQEQTFVPTTTAPPTTLPFTNPTSGSFSESVPDNAPVLAVSTPVPGPSSILPGQTDAGVGAPGISTSVPGPSSILPGQTDAGAGAPGISTSVPAPSSVLPGQTDAGAGAPGISTSVPAPSSVLLLGSGFLGLAVWRGRKTTAPPPSTASATRCN
jgi:hypothetical protein